MRITLLAVSVCVICSSCGRKGGGSFSEAAEKAPLPEPPRVASCEPGVRGGRLKVSNFSDPKTFNPITANETSSLDLIYWLFDGLVKKDQITHEMEPGLAER